MAQAHKESVLAAACVRTPVNPYTKAPLALYERELGERQQQRTASVSPQRLPRTSMGTPAAPAAALDWEEARCCKSRRCQDWVFDISKVHHPDKDYYVQVEKLKKAHLQNMEQLEKMYDKKLHLSGVHNPENEQGVVREVYRKREKQRTKDYMKELEAMEQRVLNKPLLIERVAQRNALMSAEKQYLNVLRDLGLSEEFVSKNGQSASVDEHVSVREENNPRAESTEGTLVLEDLLDDAEKYQTDPESEEAQEEDAYSTDEDHSMEEI
uniref:Protein FAM161A n=1 Tax=Xenopus tropicalis TaxID=8364 RepID=B0BM12_XENTR|nr:Unknown (protein for MGC:184956) [Xenopus tropicalis]